MVLDEGGGLVTWWRDLRTGSTRIDFVGRRRLWWRISGGLIAISVIALTLNGLNLGIEFRGGVSITTDNPNRSTIEEVRAVTAQAGIANAVVQMLDDGNAVRIQTPALDPSVQDALIDSIGQVTGSPRAEISVDAVGPSFGALVARQSLLALVVFLAAVMLFMTWRLEWKMAGTGIVALLHDLVITAGIYALTRFEFTPATVVAVLTILGYSLYDTVVVFDKVSEQVRSYSERLTYSEIVNRSMNLVLSRSIGTSLTSLLPVGSILFVGAVLFGATSLRDFALALFIGIGVGTYSSIFVAAPLLAAWKEKEEEWVDRRRRSEARAQIAAISPEPSPGAGSAGTESPPSRPSVPPRRPPTPPRPPKKKRRR
jgi:preprotein translocase subunit SecF